MQNQHSIMRNTPDKFPDLAGLVSVVVGEVLATATTMEPYRRDRAHDPKVGVPFAVVLAESTADVQAAVRWAVLHGVVVVTRGAGTGLSGGSSAIDGALVISTERMRALAIDTQTRIAVVQPGLLNAELKSAVAERGLWYPPDPASYEICSIGGNVATNAGGLCCVKYGVTADYVLGMEVVLSDGRAVRLGGPLVKDVAGLSLVKLFVGSEGTLGIITEVTLRLLPAQPASRTVVGWFSSTEQAAAAILEIAAGLRPSMLEYMDRTSINAAEDMLGLGLDRSSAALVIARSDMRGLADPEIPAMLDALHRHGSTKAFECADAAEGESYAHARRMVIPAVELSGPLMLGDVGVSITRLADLVAGVERIAAARDVTIAFIAHAGDGNTHPLVVFDPSDPELTARATLAYGEVMDLALELGGTITGEHGVGRLKRPWLVKQIGDDVLELSQRIKDALDPSGLFNPGVIFAGTAHSSRELS
jgi:glycolate oxidase